MLRLRGMVRSKLDRLPLSYFDANQKGEIMSKLNVDIENINNTLQQTLTGVISGLTLIVGIIISMFLINFFLGLIITVTLPLLVLTTRIVGGYSQKLHTKQMSVMGNLNGQIEETYNGHKIVKLYGREETATAEFEYINNALQKTAAKANFISGIIQPSLQFLNNLSYVLIVIVGSYLASGGNWGLGVGEVFQAAIFARFFTDPVNRISNIASVIQSTLASSERVFKLLDEKEEVQDADDVKSSDDIEGNITFEGVDFSYDQNRSLIKNLNLSVKKGDSIAIVGPTGAGKTTIVNLLMRFYELDGGSIKIDGIDLRKYAKGATRGAFGMVLQDTWLFSGTLRENIAYGRPNATEEEIKKACRDANILAYIESLPDGLDTKIREDANNLSQGQKQLITIARALITNPKILILDEATSSVDTRTEEHIQNALATLAKGRTSFIIAHRLSTIKKAAQIIVVRDGDIVEQGTHRELLKLKGFYAELYYSQFSGMNI
jgi:ATP-binding cassette subfamily B protein